MEKRLLKFEIKNKIKILPKLLILGILISLFAGFTANYLSHSVFFENYFEKAKIALVTKNDKNLKFLFDYADSMESTENSLKFLEYEDEISAKTDLQKGKIDAILLPPENVLEGIISGENKKVKILFKDKNSLYSTIIEEFANAESASLSSVQASIYSLNEIKEISLRDYDEIIEELNEESIALTLSRRDLFEKNALKIMGDFSIFEYYEKVIVFSTLFIMSICFSESYSEKNIIRYRFYKSKGINTYKNQFITELSNFAILEVAFLCLFLLLKIKIKDLDFKFFIFMQLVLVEIVAFSDFSFLFFKEKSGILSIIFALAIFGILGGLILPQEFFPPVINRFNKINPATFTLEYMLKKDFCSGIKILLFAVFLNVISAIKRKNIYE